MAIPRAVNSVALAGLAAFVGCLARTVPDPPLFEGVAVTLAPEAIAVSVANLTNPNGVEIKVCLEEVVIQPSDRVPARCAFAGSDRCVVLDRYTTVGHADFVAQASCPELSGPWVRVLADLSYRSVATGVWRRTAVLAEARAVRVP